MDERLLRAEGFAALPSPTVPSGVYALLRGQEVLYIGLSKAIYSRIANHYAVKKRNRIYVSNSEGKPIPFDRILVKWCSAHDAKVLESVLIHRYRPPYNKKVVEPIVDQGIDLDALAESVGISWSKEQEDGERRRMMQHSSLRRSLVT